jgi:hypothetical protein
MLYEEYDYYGDERRAGKNKSKNFLGNKRMKINYHPRNGKDLLI